VAFSVAIHAYANDFHVFDTLLSTQQVFSKYSDVAERFAAFLASDWFVFVHLGHFHLVRISSRRNVALAK
jgi:hypothetical protein